MCVLYSVQTHTIYLQHYVTFFGIKSPIKKYTKMSFEVGVPFVLGTTLGGLIGVKCSMYIENKLMNISCLCRQNIFQK